MGTSGQSMAIYGGRIWGPLRRARRRRSRPPGPLILGEHGLHHGGAGRRRYQRQLGDRQPVPGDGHVEVGNGQWCGTSTWCCWATTRGPCTRGARRTRCSPDASGSAPRRATLDQPFVMREGTLEGATKVCLLASHMAEAGWIESQSFDMHVRSTASRTRVLGSMCFGGYGRNSVVGDVLAVSRTSFEGAALVDVPLDVTGGSPFKEGNENDSVPGEATTTRHSGLLAAGNDTVGARLGVAVEACAPHLNLPRSTSDAVAAHLPRPILRGPGVDGANNARRVDISVAFAHPNLTLDRPLVGNGPKPYFPLQRGLQRLLLARRRPSCRKPSSAPTSRRPRTGWRRPRGPNIAGEQVMVIESGEDGGDDAASASGASGPAIGVGVGVGVGCGALLLAPAGLVAWRYRRHGKGLQVCGVTLLGNRGEPKTYYGRGRGGQKPYETVVPIQYGVAELPPQGVDRAAAEMEVPPAPPAAYSVYEMAGGNAYNSQ
ncbi:hypothetical protein DL770_010946 [Monosporascus sp. CRB-9-2]|nr:hypothetical protein DL770_010946 [Monosporascus sp. CRB-9-2]